MGMMVQKGTSPEGTTLVLLALIRYTSVTNRQVTLVIPVLAAMATGMGTRAVRARLSPLVLRAVLITTHRMTRLLHLRRLVMALLTQRSLA